MSRHAGRRAAAAAIALVAGAIAAVSVPALAPGDAAPPATGSFTAQDIAWDATGTTSHVVTIAVGGTVTFGYPSGVSFHNADFSDGPAPTSCAQTAGADSGPVPPLPAVPTAPGWSGSCRFDAPGTYRFHCDLHLARMQGTVVVVDPNAPPPPPPGTSGTTVTPTTPGQTSPAPGGGSSPPGQGGTTVRRLRVSVAHRQQGAVVRGLVQTPLARSRVTVTALVSTRLLARRRPKHPRLVSVGARDGRSDASGRAVLALTLNAAARSALHRRGRLAVALRVVVVPPSGRRTTTTVAVALRERAPASS